MGKREIIAKLSDDLNIARYGAESETAFILRLTYSAMGHWARFLAAYNDNNNRSSGNIYKSTHHKRLTDSLKNYRDVFNEISEYYDNEDAVNLIRLPLFLGGDLVETGFDSRIAISNNPYFGETTSNNVQHASKNTISSGMFSMNSEGYDNIKNDVFLEQFSIPTTSAMSILDERLSCASWEKIANLENYEVFDDSRKGVLSNCWSYSQVKTNGTYLVRKKLSYGPFEYAIVKKENNEIFLAKFSEIEQSNLIKLPQRMMYGFKTKGSNPYVINVDIYKEYSIWHFWSKLPPQEEGFLRYIGWPLNNIENRTNEYVVRNEFNNLLQQISDNLGLVREEIKHE